MTVFQEFIVDCEAYGPTPYSGTMTEFAAINLTTKTTFHGRLYNVTYENGNHAKPIPVGNQLESYQSLMGGLPLGFFPQEQTAQSSYQTIQPTILCGSLVPSTRLEYKTRSDTQVEESETFIPVRLKTSGQAPDGNNSAKHPTPTTQ